MFANGAQHSTSNSHSPPGRTDQGVQIISWVTGWLVDSLTPTRSLGFPYVPGRRLVGAFALGKSPPSPHMSLQWLKANILRDPARNAFFLTCGPKCPKFTSPIAHPSHNAGYLRPCCSFGFTRVTFTPLLDEQHVRHRDHRPDKLTPRGKCPLGPLLWAPSHHLHAIIHAHT